MSKYLLNYTPVLCLVNGYLRDNCKDIYIPECLIDVIMYYYDINSFNPSINVLCKWKWIKSTNYCIGIQSKSNINIGGSWCICILPMIIKNGINEFIIDCIKKVGGGGQGIGICTNPSGILSANDSFIFPFDNIESGVSYYWYFDAGESRLYEYSNGKELTTKQTDIVWNENDKINIRINMKYRNITFGVNGNDILQSLNNIKENEYYFAIVFNMYSVYKIKNIHNWV